MADADRQRLGPTAFLTRPATSAELVGSRPKQAEATPDVGNQSARGFAASCPARLPNPSSCPFGGICHSCPAPIQAKLVVGAPNDKYEQEADRIADEVMRMPDPWVQRSCPTCEDEEPVQAKPLADRITPFIQRQEEPEEEEEEPIQTKLTSKSMIQLQDEEPEEEDEEPIQTKAAAGRTAAVSPRLAARIASLRGGGRPLSTSERRFFEPRFGRSFKDVRLHMGANATETARSLNARAFTRGRGIAFGSGAHTLQSAAGKRLLAHELAHTAQQDERAGDEVRRYTKQDKKDCPCLDWSLWRTMSTARLMALGGDLTARHYASVCMRRFLERRGGIQYIPFREFRATPTSGATRNAALDAVNKTLVNGFLIAAEDLPCGASLTGVQEKASRGAQFKSGEDLFYAMGGFTLTANAIGTVSKECDAKSRCKRITAQMDIRYRVDDYYDWRSDTDPCTPTTGETGCKPNKKAVKLPGIGRVCDECLNRLVIHGRASEFDVRVRGRAKRYTVSGPCNMKLRVPPTPSVRDNEREDP